MEPWLIGAIVGAIVGGIVGGIGAARKSSSRHRAQVPQYSSHEGGSPVTPAESDSPTWFEGAKRVLFAALWMIVIYFAACIVLGAIAGAIAGANDPQNAHEVGKKAGQEVVRMWRMYLLAAAVVISALGGWFRFLPGTKR